MNKRLRILVDGKVQGVFFRASTQEQAQRLGLTGFVRNLPDGRVEVVAEGPAGAVDALADWCRHGPPGARVEAVVLREEACQGEFDGFEIRFS